MPEKDAFDLWWAWATKDRETDFSTIDAEIHDAVMALTPEERKDRETVNRAVREGAGPWREAGTADTYGVPRATE